MGVSLVAYWDQFPPPTTGGGGGTGTVTNINTTAPITGGPITTTGTIGITDFVASGVGHARGAVPDPGAVAGSTKFLCENGLWATPAGGGTPAGSSTQIQFNTGGAFDADADFTWDKANNTLTLGTAARITTDTSNATQSNRFWFQNSVANANTNFGVMPSGSGATATSRYINSSNPNAANSMLQVGISSTTSIIDATVLNAGTQGTLELRIGGTAKATVTAAGDFQLTGDLERIKGVTLDWPNANAAGVLTNDALGNLSWTAVTPGIGGWNWGKAIALQQGTIGMMRTF